METSGLFAQYEAEYCRKSTDVSKRIQGLAALAADQRRSQAASVDADLREAESILQRLDMEARSFSPDRQRELLQKVKDYRADLGKLKEDAKRASRGQASADSRAELGLGDDYYATSAGQRERLLNATDRLDKTSDRIQQGRVQLLETEATGTALLAELQRQRESIQRSRQAAQQVASNVAEADGVAKRMSKWWRLF